MSKVLFMVGIVALYITGVYLRENSKDPIAQALDSLKEEDRKDFLAFALGLGLLDWANTQQRVPKFLPKLSEDIFLKTLSIPDEKIQQFKKMQIPVESRKKLLDWTQNDFNLSKKDVLDLVRNKKCRGPNCIGLEDLGPLCCPW